MCTKICEVIELSHSKSHFSHLTVKHTTKRLDSVLCRMCNASLQLIPAVAIAL